MRLLSSLVTALLAITGALAPAYAAPSGPHPITLGALPPSPILPGDLLTLRGKSRFTHGQLNGLEFSLGGRSAEVLAIDNNTVKVIVPAFVPQGPQPLTVMRHGRVEFSHAVPIGAIHVSAAGDEPDFRFGLNFADPKTFAVGTPVSGWLQTADVKTGTGSPVSVAGKITGNLGGILSLSLASDTSGTTGKLSVAALDLGTGKFFGTLFESVSTLPITGTATITVKPTIPITPSPVITSITPNPAPPGALITIDGRGFGAAQGLSTVTWNGKPVVDFPLVTSWTDTRIVARLGRFDVGLAPVVVTVGRIPSIPVDLIVQPPCPPASEFAKRFGGGKDDGALAVRQTRDCGFIVAGRTASFGLGGFDVYLIKTDGNGEVQWTRTFGGKGDDEAFAVQQTRDDGYIVAGRTTSTEAPFNAAGSEFLLIKVTATGALEWLRTYGGKADEGAYGVHQTTDDGYAVAGWTESFGIPKDLSPPSRNVLLVKTDRDGGRQWGRVYGGAGLDEARAVRQTRDTGYVLAGFTTSFGGGSRGFVVKADSFGEQQWTRTYGASGADELHAVQELPDAGYALGGRTRGKGGDFNFFFVTTSMDGAAQITRTYGGAGNDEAFAVAFTSDGGYALGGRTTSADLGAVGVDGMLVKTDCQGTQQFRRLFALGKVDDAAFSMQQIGDGGYVLAGFIQDPGAAPDALLVRFAPFPSSRPEIVAFTANGLAFREIEPPTGVELFWRVRNASQIHVERLAGPGPAFDTVFGGGADVTNQTSLSFAMDPRDCLDGCADTIYRLTATSACDSVEAHVSVRTVVSAAARELIEIEDVLVQRFAGGLPSLIDGYVNSHPNFQRLPPDLQNTCFLGQGKPFARPGLNGFPTVDDPIDAREPDLVTFDSNNTLAGWAYARKFKADQKPTGIESFAPAEKWFVHEGGWHTGDGAMIGWPFRDPPDPPAAPYEFSCPFPCVFPEFPRFRGIECPGFDDGCGPFIPPFIAHPALWDLHVFRNTASNGAPVVTKLSTDIPGMSDLCGAAGGFGTTSLNTPTPMERFPDF